MNRAFLVCGLLLAGAGSLLAQSSVVPARLSLDDALRIAEARNPQLVVAQQGVVASDADVMGAGKRPNPVFTLSSEGIPLSEQNRPPFFDNQELAFNVQQELEPGGRRRFRTEQAQRGADVARAVSRDALRQLRFEVRRAYMQVVLAKVDDEVARTTLEEIDKVLALNRVRYEQGELSGVELRRLQVERFRFADDAFVAELALKNSRSALLALLDLRPLDQPFDTVDDLLPPPIAATIEPQPAATDAPISLALASRPDLDAARRERERAEAGFRLQRALRTPSIFVEAGVKRDFGANGLIFSFGVPLPIFNRNEAAVARASAEQQQATARLAAAEIQVSLDVQEALNAIDVTRRRVRYVEGEYLKSAREARDIVLASYRSGAATLIDYLDAQRALREALRTENRARFDYRISLFQYEAAVGTPAAAQGKEMR
ncbi:MAG: TolC family protein [Acidobacteria bacterium]|nr:TolC family protein [Acidobacteriota bacterium]